MGWVSRAEEELRFFEEDPGLEVDNVVALRDLLEAHLSLLPHAVSRRRAREAIALFDESEDINDDAAVEIADYLRRVLVEARYRMVHRRR